MPILQVKKNVFEPLFELQSGEKYISLVLTTVKYNLSQELKTDNEPQRKPAPSIGKNAYEGHLFHFDHFITFTSERSIVSTFDYNEV